MTWTGLSFPYGSILTSAKITQLYDNITAQANGDTGAPKQTDSSFNTNSINGNKMVSNSVSQTQVGPGAIHTSELDTTLGSASAATAILGNCTGGAYCFAIQARVDSGTGYIWGGSSFSAPITQTSFGTYYYMYLGTNTTNYLQWRYVNSSPPHDLGDGDVNGFVYALLDKNGKVVAVQIAMDPIWQAMGPTKAMPDLNFEGKNYIRTRDGYIELTEDIKHADMDVIPHPWAGHDIGDLTPVLLDPMSDEVFDIMEMHLDSTDEAHEVFHKEFMTVGNEGLERHGPTGLLIPKPTWRKSK